MRVCRTWYYSKIQEFIDSEEPCIRLCSVVLGAALMAFAPGSRADQGRHHQHPGGDHRHQGRPGGRKGTRRKIGSQEEANSKKLQAEINGAARQAQQDEQRRQRRAEAQADGATSTPETKSFNRQVEDAQAELDQEQGRVLNELGGKMLAVLDKYAKDNGYAVILDVSQQNTPVLFAANSIDVTQEVVALYDKNAPAAAAPSGTVPSATKPLTTPGALQPNLQSLRV